MDKSFEYEEFGFKTIMDENNEYGSSAGLSNTEPPETSTRTTLKPPVKKPPGKPCGSMTNEFCVKRDQCGTHTGKIIIDLTRPQGVCHYMETCCQQSNISQSVSIVQHILESNTLCTYFTYMCACSFSTLKIFYIWFSSGLMTSI